MKRWQTCLHWLVVLVALPAAATSAADRRPNILFLVADEFRHDCLSAAGHLIVKTPNFDALAREGVRLSRAYVAAPVCSPSRATLFTGRYPKVHGVTANNMPFAPGEVVLPEILHAHGYTTGIVGKLHLQNYQGWFDYDQVDTEGSSAEYRAFLRAAADEPAKKAARRKDGPGSVARTFINDPEILREAIAHYYGAVTMVDKQMGRVLAALEDAGFKDDTIVVFTAALMEARLAQKPPQIEKPPR
jgi:arylsulfatase A-like enzyme